MSSSLEPEVCQILILIRYINYARLIQPTECFEQFGTKPAAVHRSVLELQEYPDESAPNSVQ